MNISMRPYSIPNYQLNHFCLAWRSNDETCRDVYRVLLLSYGHLRGKDLVKRKKALSKGDTTVGHRQQIASISNPALRSGKTSKKEKVEQENADENVTNATPIEIDNLDTITEEAATTALAEFDAIIDDDDSDEEES